MLTMAILKISQKNVLCGYFSKEDTLLRWDDTHFALMLYSFLSILVCYSWILLFQAAGVI
jgi:hypothetical protein